MEWDGFQGELKRKKKKMVERGMERDGEKKWKKMDGFLHLCVRAFMILAFCSGPARSGVVKLFCL